ncbi:hypothetical protein POTOM_040677 [Populus tomentosa]|uniref:S5 DRBM domain-containing protein n=1 Tax=Populus tomentosa TaxID=118781 RepID=A0A8X7YQI8_POPTO|nr:hypothetical protein POTOM_040677 [Populus tomentosa]
METEEEIVAAYEELYGPACNGFQAWRVTEVVKGGKQLHFRAAIVVGDKQGQVGVGVGKAREVIAVVSKSALNARRNIITVPMTKYLTFFHSLEMRAVRIKAARIVGVFWLFRDGSC